MFQHAQHSIEAIKAGQMHMSIISQNIANARSTGTAEDPPYRGKSFQYQKTWKQALQNHMPLGKAIEDQKPFNKQFYPGHPMADKQGFILTSNVNMLEQLSQLRLVEQYIKANIKSLEGARGIRRQVIGLLRTR